MNHLSWLFWDVLCMVKTEHTQYLNRMPAVADMRDTVTQTETSLTQILLVKIE